MSERSQRLAEQLTRANDGLIAMLAGCSEEQWRARCPSEGWSVGVTAHHLATDYPVLLGLVQAVASGQPLPPLTQEAIDQFNAQHAAEHANAGRLETLALLRSEGAATAAAIAALSDAELDRTAPLPWGDGTPLSAEQYVQALLISHIPEHAAGIRAALASVAPAASQRA